MRNSEPILSDKRPLAGATNAKINGDTINIIIYYFDEENLAPKSYTFQDKVKANIYDDLNIDFSTISI